MCLHCLEPNGRPWRSSVMTITAMFYDIGLKKIIRGDRWQRRSDLVDAARALTSAVNVDGVSSIDVGCAVRRAGCYNEQSIQICQEARCAALDHPDARSHLEPLFAEVCKRARVLRVPETGTIMLRQALWAALVGHGIPGARLPPRPTGIVADLFTVPRHPDECESRHPIDVDEGQGKQDYNPGWR